MLSLVIPEQDKKTGAGLSKNRKKDRISIYPVL
jgi:hypothetical protein